MMPVKTMMTTMPRTVSRHNTTQTTINLCVGSGQLWDVAREAWEEVWEEVVSSRHCHRPGRSGDKDNDARGDEQDMPYANADMLSHNWRRAEGGEGDVDDGSNNKHIDWCVQGLRWVDNGEGQRQSSGYDGCNDDEDKEGGLHPTPWTTATHELAARLHSASGRHRRKRERLMTGAMRNMSTSVSGVHVGRIPGISKGRDQRATATTTTTTRRMDCSPPRGRW